MCIQVTAVELQNKLAGVTNLLLLLLLLLLQVWAHW
jgi:hypothetical protein